MNLDTHSVPSLRPDLHATLLFLKERILGLAMNLQSYSNLEPRLHSSLREKIYCLATTISSRLDGTVMVGVPSALGEKIHALNELLGLEEEDILSAKANVKSSFDVLEEKIQELTLAFEAREVESFGEKADIQAMVESIESQKVGENSTSKAQEKNEESMEVEEESSTQAGGVQQSDSSEILFWQTQKLPSFKEEMKKLLGEGLPGYEVRSLTEERVKELLEKADGDLKSENNKEILIRLLAEKIESSRENQGELAKKCKEYVESLGNKFEGLDETYYMDLICSSASYKSYLDIKPTYLENGAAYLVGYEVWEVKNMEWLKEVSNVDEVNVMKAQRRWKVKVITALDKLIKSIQKVKNAGDMKKVWTQKDKYEEAMKSRKPEYVEKTPKKSTKKRKHKNLEEGQGATEAKDLETEALISLKKLKLNSEKNSVVKSPSGKTSVAKVAVQLNPIKQNEEFMNLSPQDDQKKGKETAKKEKEKEKEKEKNNNQKNLMNFFKKKPAENEQKAENKGIQVTQNSKLRCLGSLEARPEWDSSRAEAFDSIFNTMGEKPSVEELLALAKGQTGNKRQFSGNRKIFISIHDSCKKIKGKYDGVSSKIGGKKPFEKDETIIDYEIDSEDEMQEYNAENIDEDRPSDNNESDMDEEDEEDFIVPDGYVSKDENPDDGSDSGDNENEKLENKNNLKFKEDLDFKSRPKAFFFSMIEDYEPGKDMQLDDYLNNFKIIKLVEEEYPLKPKKAREVNLQTTGKAKLNPEAINDDDLMRELILTLHGEFSKPDTIKKINAKFPSCSKSAIERKISELETNEQIKKDKLPGESKARWVIQKEFFLKFGSEEEYKKILSEKLEKELERQKIEKEKREAEKRLKQLCQTLNAEMNKENEENDSKENSNDKPTNDKPASVRKTVQANLSFGQFGKVSSESQAQRNNIQNSDDRMEEIEVVIDEDGPTSPLAQVENIIGQGAH